MAETYTVPRSGQMPLRFTGELLAEQTQEPEFVETSKIARRWHELRLFKTESDKIVVAVRYRTTMNRETEGEVAQVFDSIEPAIDWLSDPDRFDPLDWVCWWPDGERYKAQNDGIEQRLTNEFELRVGRLLSDAGFAEEV